MKNRTEWLFENPKFKQEAVYVIDNDSVAGVVMSQENYEAMCSHITELRMSTEEYVGPATFEPITQLIDDPSENELEEEPFDVDVFSNTVVTKNDDHDLLQFYEEIHNEENAERARSAMAEREEGLQEFVEYYEEIDDDKI